MRSKTLKHLLIFSPLIVISACSNDPVIETSYYLLDAPDATKNNSEKTEPITTYKPSTSLEIKVAEYLDQPYLIIQTDQYQVNFAQSHMWAEPLVKAIARTLRLDLNKSSRQTNFIEHNPSKVSENDLLAINIDYFHPNHLGKVILTGNYIWRTASPDLSTLKNNTFHIEKKLQMDGYHHSVKQMRAILKELAVQITIQ